MSKFNHEEWRTHVKDTENLEPLAMTQLKEQLTYFNGVSACMEVVTDQTPFGKLNICNGRIKLLRAEIQHRRSRKPSWAAILSLFVGAASLCLGIYNCSHALSTPPAEARSTPTATATPRPMATPASQ
jgi:hypothetical protein